MYDRSPLSAATVDRPRPAIRRQPACRGRGRPSWRARHDSPPGARRLRAVAAFVALAVVGLAACGGSGGSAGPAVAGIEDLADAPAGSAAPDITDAADPAGADAPADFAEAALAHARCMREHGVDMPDPQADGDGRVVMMTEDDGDGAGPDMETMEAALAACEHLFDNVRSEVEIDPERAAEMREQMLAYAQCMREHGVDMPDPRFDDDGGVNVVVGGDGGDIDPAAMDAANAACAQADGGLMMSATGAAVVAGDAASEG